MGNILISPDFAVLWLKQSMTALCDALFTTTLMIWLGVSTNSPISVGLALGAMGAGYVLFGPFAEAATERWSRRKTMFVTDVVRSISTLLLTLALLPFLTPKRALALICLLCFVIGLMSRFSLAAQRSSLNAVTPPREHARGISRIQGSVALMTIIGPILAAMLFLFPSLLFPPGTPLLGLLATGFLLLLSAGGAQAMDREFTAKVRAINLRRKGQTQGPDGQPLEEEDDSQAEEEEERWSPSVLRSGIANWVKGIRVVLQQPTFATIARVAALVAFAGGILNVLEVFYVSDTLSRPGAFLGLLLGADAAGILLGSVLFRYLDGHLRPSTNFAYAVPALGMATMALVTTTSFGEALFWAGAMGVANGVMLLAAQTALVETEAYDKLPRLFVGYDTLTALLSLAGIIVGGLAAHSFKINTVLLVAGLLLTLSGILGWLALSGILKGSKKGQAVAPQPVEESEQTDMDGYDENMDGYEPAEEEEPAYDEAPEEEEEAPAPPPRLTRQFGRPWAAQQMNNPMDDQDAGRYEEDEQPYDDGGEQDDPNAWEPEQPIEEAPMPRPSLRLRPKPWEQPDRSGRTRW